MFYANSVQHATRPGSNHAEKTSFVSINCIPEREGGGPWQAFGRRIADLSIYLPCRSVFWRIVFDWLPSDTKRAVSCEMHQDFGANARVPPKSAPGRLENASSAVSLPNQCPGPPPSLSEIAFVDSKLVFSAEWRPRGCDQLFVFGFSRVCFGSSV